MNLKAFLLIVFTITIHPGTPSRIIGGTQIVENKYPWVARLTIEFSSGTSICSGSLVYKNMVGTAAHCLWDSGISNVVAGDKVNVALARPISSDLTTGIDVGVKEAWIHHLYNPVTSDNDIGVLILDRDITDIEPIPLLSPGSGADNVGSQATVIGYGRDESGFASVTIRDVDLTIVDNTICIDYLGFPQKNFFNLLCTNGFFQGPSSGDSGGPLIVTDTDGVKKLAGITSYGFTTPNFFQGANYTRITHFWSWISLFAINHADPQDTGIAKTVMNSDLLSQLQSGWHFKGTEHAIDRMSIFDQLEVIWTQIDGQWRFYSSDQAVIVQLQDQYQAIDTIPAGNGIWLKVR